MHETPARPFLASRPGFPFLCLAAALAACAGPLREGSSESSALDEEVLRVLERAGGERGIDLWRLPEEGDLAAIPQDPKNPLSAAKIELGMLLFHDTALSRATKLSWARGTVSCSSCHHARAGFQAGTAHAVGEGGLGFGRHGEGRALDPRYQAELDSVDAQPLRSPSALNVAYQENILWNGSLGAGGYNEGTKYAWMGGAAFNRLGFRGAEAQAIAAMDTHGLTVDGLIVEVPAYKALFDVAFPDLPEHLRYADRAAGQAIGAYERALLTNRAPLQRWLRGDRRAMSDPEKRGAILFFGRAGCAGCHAGPSLAAMRFEALGMADLIRSDRALVVSDTLLVQDTTAVLGRGGFTRNRHERYAFKVPQLYNLADSPFYGHGGSFNSIREVVEYKNVARPQNPSVPPERLSPLFVPLGLTDREIDDLVAFLERSLHDPDLARYVPERVPSGRCFPFNDPLSRRDLGCDPPQDLRQAVRR